MTTPIEEKVNVVCKFCVLTSQKSNEIQHYWHSVDIIKCYCICSKCPPYKFSTKYILAVTCNMSAKIDILLTYYFFFDSRMGQDDELLLYAKHNVNLISISQNGNIDKIRLIFAICESKYNSELFRDGIVRRFVTSMGKRSSGCDVKHFITPPLT